VKTFKDLDIKPRYFSGSENIPLEFYENTFPVAKEINLFLGYFSSNAIRELALSFSAFIINEGDIRIITNHVYSKDDHENLIVNDKLNDEDKYFDIISDIEKLQVELSKYGKHFFDCLKFLKKHDRLKIQPVKWKGGNAHTKNMILFDGKNYLSTDGSTNFTLSGLTINGERFSVTKSWHGDYFEKAIMQDYEDFNNVFDKKNNRYEYLDSNSVFEVIDKIGTDREKNELIKNSVDLLGDHNDHIRRIREKRNEKKFDMLIELESKPKFPFPKKGPRDYQKLAYEKWIENGKKGIFNMATGTGKTITSLNFILNEFNKSGNYKVFILVPTVALLHQWKVECEKFNFSDSLITTKDRKWREELKEINYDIQKLNKTRSFILITTYATFHRQNFQTLFKTIDKNEVTLIADECHNVGSNALINILPNDITYRIGLSATPERKYDLEGSEKMYAYFNAYPDCFTFSYSMFKAIKNESLCEYNYYPIFCSLNEDELKHYKSYSKRLIMNYNDKTKKFNEEGKRLLIERKRIVHKAKDKLIKLKNLLSEDHDFKYTFIYVPEGKEVSYDEEDIIEDAEDVKIISDYLEIVKDLKFRAKTVTGTQNDRENSLNRFKEGKIDMLLAMKILDEGVDIPITKNAIFCSSTGNPRQFIQRRGRVLRTYENKSHANIWDMVVIPKISDVDDDKEYHMEKNILKSEILRVANFVYSSKNIDSFKDSELSKICKIHEIDLDSVIQENIEKDQQCDYE
jgi:superfamily II DNA or RNA helicase